MTDECNETTEEYTYKIGDIGTLKNGEDTYRIVADDMVVRPVGTTEFPLLALIINNSHSNEGYVNIYEQSTSYAANGWSLSHALAGPGGTNYYDLVPPE